MQGKKGRAAGAGPLCATRALDRRLKVIPKEINDILLKAENIEQHDVLMVTTDDLGNEELTELSWRVAVKDDQEALTDARKRGSRATRRIKGSRVPARRHARVRMLSPDAVRAVSPSVISSSFSSFSPMRTQLVRW